MSPKQELNQALNRMKYLHPRRRLAHIQNPGGWYHITDATTAQYTATGKVTL